MQIRPWEVPIRATGHRASELTEVRFDRKGLTLRLVEEDTERPWVMTFASVQAFKSTTEECAASILSRLPEQGGFFEVFDSPWIDELGRGKNLFLNEARHYVICCYDEIIEIVGGGCRLEKA